MRVLTVHQPWAWAIAARLKPVENRPCAIPYRGLVAIQEVLARLADTPDAPPPVPLLSMSAGPGST